MRWRWGRRHRHPVRGAGAKVALLPARGHAGSRARPAGRAAGDLAVRVLHRADRHAGADPARPARHRRGARAQQSRQPVGGDHRRPDVWLRHGFHPRLRQPDAGAVGHRQSARAALGARVRGGRANGARRRAVAAAFGNQRSVDGGRLRARPAGDLPHGPWRRHRVQPVLAWPWRFSRVALPLGVEQMARRRWRRPHGRRGLGVQLCDVAQLVRIGAGACAELQLALGRCADVRAETAGRGVEFRPRADPRRVRGQLPRRPFRRRAETRRLSRRVEHAPLHRRGFPDGARRRACRRLRGGRGGVRAPPSSRSPRGSCYGRCGSAPC